MTEPVKMVKAKAIYRRQTACPDMDNREDPWAWLEKHFNYKHEECNYVVVWETEVPETCTPEDLYIILNVLDDNPLYSDENQKKLEELGVDHSLMSIGDIAEIDGCKYLCLSKDWCSLLDC